MNTEQDVFRTLGQAAAATAAGASFLSDYQRDKGGTVQPGEKVYGHAATIVNRVLDRCRSGGVAYCEHLTPDAPAQPMFWLPYAAPLMLRCASCHDEIELAMPGTEADRICDWCGTLEEPGWVYGVAYGVPGAAVLTPRMRAVGPILITFGLCRVCHAASTPPGQEESTDDE